MPPSSSISDAPPAKRLPTALGRDREGTALALALVIPVAVAAVYLAIFVARLPAILQWSNEDSDSTAAFLITQTVASGHAGAVSMGTQGSWLALWFGLLTDGLPFHRAVWEVAPEAVSLLAAAVLGYTVSRLTDWRRGALTGALCVAVSPVAARVLSAAYLHNTTVLGVVVLDSFLVWLVADRRPHRHTPLAGLGAAVVAGVCVASDEMMLTAGVLPFVIAGGWGAARRRRRCDAVVVAGVTGGAVAVAAITTHVMGTRGLVAASPPFALALNVIPRHAEWLLDGLLRLGNGLGVTPDGSVGQPLALLAGAATLTGVGTAGWQGVRALRRAPSPRATPARASDVHCLYWAVSLAMMCALYLTDGWFTDPADRYLITCVFAVAGIVPVAVRGRRASWALALGATAVAAAGTVALVGNHERPAFTPVTVAHLTGLERVVARDHLSRGYASYWEAGNAAWSSAGRLAISPVSASGNRLVPMPEIATAAAWYRPVSHIRSFLLLIPDDPSVPDVIPSSLPRPQRIVTVGPIHVLEYPFDIARDLG